MGTFSVEVTIKNLSDRLRSASLTLLVDTGSTYTVLPRQIVEALGLEVLGTRRVRLANGRADQWPMVAVLMALEGQELPALCLMGPAGGPALLGALSLEAFALGVDPVTQRLVPIESYLMACAR
jgi:predicted aspartyl protease